MPGLKPTTKMQWVIIGLAAAVLLGTVAANIMNNDIDPSAAFYLFTAVSAMVFGASISSKWK